MEIVESSPSPESRSASRAMGAMIFAFFGWGWLVLWTFRGLRSRGFPLTVIAIGGVAIFSYALRRYRQFRGARAEETESPTKKRTNRIFHIVNAGQWIVILIVGNVLVNVHRSAWVIPSAIFIIGLHFVPLARIFSNPPHYVTGAALMLLAVGYPFVVPGGPNSAFGCLGAGLILWASALWAVIGASSVPRTI